MHVATLPKGFGQGVWYGKGARILGLEPEVSKEDLVAIVKLSRLELGSRSVNWVPPARLTIHQLSPFQRLPQAVYPAARSRLQFEDNACRLPSLLAATRDS